MSVQSVEIVRSVAEIVQSVEEKTNKRAIDDSPATPMMPTKKKRWNLIVDSSDEDEEPVVVASVVEMQKSQNAVSIFVFYFWLKKELFLYAYRFLQAVEEQQLEYEQDYEINAQEWFTKEEKIVLRYNEMANQRRTEIDGNYKKTKIDVRKIILSKKKPVNDN